ncbi:hypothetical protein [Rubritalea tangerina]
MGKKPADDRDPLKAIYGIGFQHPELCFLKFSPDSCEGSNG